MARIVARTGENVEAIGNWGWLATAADAVAAPAELPHDSAWLEAAVPGTVAGTLRALGRLADDTAEAIGRQDHWYRTRLDRALSGVLRFEGLASWTEIWIDGTLAAESRSMFQPLALAVNLPAGAEIALCFRALAPRLASAPRRSRWRPAMIQPNGLRWFRTTALGSMPGWCPPGLPTGPFRPVQRVEIGNAVPVIAGIDLRTRYDGEAGTVALTVSLSDDTRGISPRALMRCAGREAALDIAAPGTLSGTLSLPGVAPWFPHTHGTPALHGLTLLISGETIDLGRIGFRSLAVDRGADGEGFGIVVNDVPIFCRGACWSSADLATLACGRAAYEPWLRLARDAGMNMIRVPGVTTYEDEAFFELCDELGIMVWQEMMLANFDYPQGDAAFCAAIQAEAETLLDRTQGSPSLVVLCGGSEVFQQAAMLGAPPAAWSGPVFDRILPEVVSRLRPNIAYVPNSPSGGPLPFVADKGVAHYYGVGAYQRGLDDARRATVRFAAESLAFANVPEEISLASGHPPALTHHPDWKRGVPRDLGASWDFEDVRDHYLGLLYGLDPARLRREDPQHYLALSRATSAEVMEETFAEWRRPGSPTCGALVWLLQDLVPGAGWGVIASDGEPKAAWHGLARAFRPVQVMMTDEGVNGLMIHLINERPVPLTAHLELTCWRDGAVAVANASRTIALEAYGSTSFSAFDLLGRFFDISYAYRFGPPGHDATSVVLRAAQAGPVLADAFHFPLGRGHARHDVGLHAKLERDGDGWALDLSCRRLAQSVHIISEGWRPAHNWFHLAPGNTRRIPLRPRADSLAAPLGEIRAVNAVDRVLYAPADVGA
ncbi:beta-mannosidase [Bosea sp. OK403]|uniref:glycosyl hydrolase 2 galactose-binding domain-containing protein n=1 Tax=Bosea sp. OK403 TaxID=1855286 RepID=UPI0008E60EA2|nr:glycoside hydrolase family 2 protein [Bosea sp. OK403]SFJ46799.1 beta-mannosidase [Bosea sp. OK403]